MQKARRYVEEYLRGERTNPRICLYVYEAKMISDELPESYYLLKGSMVNEKTRLYMWEIKNK